jgi:glycosidase
LGSYYACSSYTKINPEFGKEADLISLIKTAHDLNMKVIIDWVANHTGRHHEWMEHHPDWFSQDAQGNFTERNGWEDVVDLNFNNAEMRRPCKMPCIIGSLILILMVLDVIWLIWFLWISGKQ